MVSGKLITSSNELNEVYCIWHEVFPERELIKIQQSNSMDYKADYVLVYDGQDGIKAIATGRLIIGFDGIAVIDGLAVLKEYRGRYNGEFALRMLLNRAFIKKCDKIIIEAPIFHIGFFENIGFVSINSPEGQKESSTVRMIYAYNELKKRCNSTYLG